jgi:large subunit ribosomal protein L29
MHEMSKEAKPADLRAKTADELQTLLLSLRKTQFNIRFQRATGQLEGLSQVRQVRRDIARVKTIIAQKKVTSSAASN